MEWVMMGMSNELHGLHGVSELSVWRGSGVEFSHFGRHKQMHSYLFMNSQNCTRTRANDKENVKIFCSALAKPRDIKSRLQGSQLNAVL